jgi:SHS family lactate transporter-like MFS transporter
MFGAGISGVTPLMLTQLFPARIRARSVGLVYHIGACVAAFVPMAMAGLVEHGGLTIPTVIAVVAAVCAVLLIPVMIFRPRVGEEATAAGPAAASEVLEGEAALIH